jgi:hypothetical protein
VRALRALVECVWAGVCEGVGCGVGGGVVQLQQGVPGARDTCVMCTSNSTCARVACALVRATMRPHTPSVAHQPHTHAHTHTHTHTHTGAAQLACGGV